MADHRKSGVDNKRRRAFLKAEELKKLQPVKEEICNDCGFSKGSRDYETSGCSHLKGHHSI